MFFCITIIIFICQQQNDFLLLGTSHLQNHLSKKSLYPTLTISDWHLNRQIKRGRRITKLINTNKAYCFELRRIAKQCWIEQLYCYESDRSCDRSCCICFVAFIHFSKFALTRKAIWTQSNNLKPGTGGFGLLPLHSEL